MSVYVRRTSDVPCEKCGKATRSRKRLCWRCQLQPKGRRERPTVTLKCEVCGATFETRRCYQHRLKTCSNECSRILPTKRAQERKNACADDLIDRTPPSVRHKTGAYERKSCAACGASFKVSVTHAHRYSTCSDACSRIKKSTDKIKYTLSLTCGMCGSEFHRTGGDDNGRNLYCSDACRLQALNSRPRPFRAANCLICGKRFRVKRDGHKYCSRACAWDDPEYRKRRGVRHTPSNCEQWLFNALTEANIEHERYYSVGRWTADCHVPEFKLLIEMDGAHWHDTRKEHDARRDRDFKAAGFQVVHFRVTDRDTEKRVKERIRAYLVTLRSAGTAALSGAPKP